MENMNANIDQGKAFTSKKKASHPARTLGKILDSSPPTPSKSTKQKPHKFPGSP